ncbi:MAG: hypothetical protein HPY83_09770 [Anaerolineae bacterium]|nr:hypothetical protein [Anaerolineae bacterium]
MPTATVTDKHGRSQRLLRGADRALHLTLAQATCNTDARDEKLVVGGDPVILVERRTQRFQVAVFEYHQEFDRDGMKEGTDLPWRNWMVQLRLLGDDYLTLRRLPFLAGDPSAHVAVPPQPAP